MLKKTLKEKITHFFKSIGRDSRGMTLIEIMVVVAIIGSIAAMVTVQVVDSLTEAKISTTKTNIRTLEGALEQYKRRHNFYPSSEQGLTALVSKPTSGKVPNNYPKNGYIKRLPKDEWGNEFIYSSPGAHGNDFEITSLGADGQEGGEDDDADINSWEMDEDAGGGNQ